MSDHARISVQGLSKAFPRRDRNKVKGVTTEGAAAFGYVLAQTLRPKIREVVPPKGSKEFLYALDDVSFEVAPGEILGIIGRNGAGKSTLLKILARVLDPTAGRVTIRGRVASMLELGIGFAPELTVRENIQIHGRLAGIPVKQIYAAEGKILEFSGLTDYQDVPLGACPSGSSVQLGFAAMVNLAVDVILADEVLAVGDAAFRHACEERVRAAGASGESVLFVSHDMNAIRRICTRVAWIDRGRLVRTGPTDEIVTAYTSELLAGRLLPPMTGDGLAASCQLLDVRLLDAERAQIGALQMTEPGYIDCLLRISRPDVAVTVEMELWQGKRHVFSTMSPRPITGPAASTFHAGFLVPAHFLNERPYQVRCRLHATNLADPEAPPLMVTEERLDFTVMNPHPQDSVWSDWSWGRPGVVSPRLSWTATPQPRATRGSAGGAGSKRSLR